jgi:16S rRNA (cytidine1402-2'-O)-methyltransferase
MGGGSFVFEGFLPATGAKRRDELTRLAADPRPFVLFEAPHRIRECLEDIVAVAGPERRVTVVREGTKLHEEILEASAAAVLESLPEKPLGEFTLVVAGASSSPDEIAVDPLQLLRFAVDLGLSPESAARRVAEAFGVPRSRLLRRAKESPAADP